MIGECELHEMSNCAICNGSDTRLKESLKPEAGPVEQNEGGVTMRAQYPGSCAGCGFTIFPGDQIFLSKSGDIGWVLVDCCLGIAQE